MTHTSKKIVFFGNERLISGLEHTDTPVLKGLIERGYNVVAIISHHSETRSRNARPLEVSLIAKEHNIPLYLPDKPTDIIDVLQSLNVDAAVLVAYGRIIPQSIIDLFPTGIINIHPSLLPKYRGPTPIESAILNGDSQTGVSIMKLSAGMDDGPIYTQETIHLAGNEKKYDLYEKISHLSASMLFDCLPDILDGTLKPKKQDDTQATYSKILRKADSIIDWNESAITIERKIRAYQEWPGTRTVIGNIDLVIVSAHIDQKKDLAPGTIDLTQPHTLRIGTAKGSLYIDTLKPIGKKEMPVKAFLAGYRAKLY